MLDAAQFAKLIADSKRIDDPNLKKATEYAAANKISLRDALIKLEMITDEELGALEAAALKIPFVTLTKVSIPAEVINLLPEGIAKKQKAVVFERTPTVIKLALANPANTVIAQALAKKTGQNITIYYATTQDITNVIALYRKDLQRKFQKLLEESLGTTTIARDADPPIEKIVTLLVDSAYHEKASDVHIEPKENESVVRFRVDGILYDSLTYPLKVHERVVTRIKVLANLRTDEHLSAQDGKMQVTLREETLNLRVSILPIADGEKVVLRLLSSKSRSFSLEELGMNEKDLAKVTRAFAKPNGMILSTGPTGSGKTTSIYAILKIINKRDRNITTVEDPVEYKIEGANQVQVNARTNLTFANGLRSILRQDPNYIFVGEIRDNETAGIAVNAALTGHLVFSTLHTNDAPTAIPRLVDMEVEPFLVASTVNIVIGQRLVRKICPTCRHSFTMSKAEILEHLSASDVAKHYVTVGEKEEIRLYKGKGCEQCHFSGYQGRLGIFEVLEVSKILRELITQKANSDVIRDQAIKDGMTTMLDDGLDKITKGMTTIEEVVRVTKVES